IGSFVEVLWLEAALVKPGEHSYSDGPARRASEVTIDIMQGEHDIVRLISTIVSSEASEMRCANLNFMTLRTRNGSSSTIHETTRNITKHTEVRFVRVISWIVHSTIARGNSTGYLASSFRASRSLVTRTSDALPAADGLYA